MQALSVRGEAPFRSNKCPQEGSTAHQPMNIELIKDGFKVQLSVCEQYSINVYVH